MYADRKRILIAEDNPVIAHVLRFNLERCGFEVSVAENGRRAIELLEGNRFDVILTDYQMPEVDGEELCRQVRLDERHADASLFLVSAKGCELNIPRLTEEFSLSKVLFKPFSPREVCNLVCASLEPAAV